MSSNILVRDFVFPLIEVDLYQKGYIFKKFLGTAFLIGNRGYALTASHIIKDRNNIIGLFVDEHNKWKGLPILESENHPIQDSSILKLSGWNFNSPFVINQNKEYGWKDYFVCGYPESVVYENIDINGMSLPSFEMVSGKGHIRRRLMKEINSVKGNSFYELSNIVGWGCSGGPIFEPSNDGNWKIIGIYVAQKIFYTENHIDENVKYIDYAVGYALTSDSIFNWIPKILKKTILEESINNQ
jgi:hypothetical protein